MNLIIQSLPIKPLTNLELEVTIKKLKIREFQGVFSRDNLPQKLSKCGILNLDVQSGVGTHWVCWYDNYYFDSFGLPPPLELTAKREFFYPTEQVQGNNEVICGHLCLITLKYFDAQAD